MRNAMFAAGLHSNWWLNPTGMDARNLAVINEPGLRFWGPLFKEMAPTGHDVAVLWSFTEIAMREKDISAPGGEEEDRRDQLLIASLPENSAPRTARLTSTPTTSAATTRSKCSSAPGRRPHRLSAHILHERLLPADGPPAEH